MTETCGLVGRRKEGSSVGAKGGNPSIVIEFGNGGQL